MREGPLGPEPPTSRNPSERTYPFHIDLLVLPDDCRMLYLGAATGVRASYHCLQPHPGADRRSPDANLGTG